MLIELVLATVAVLVLAAWVHLARPGRGQRRVDDRLRELTNARDADRYYVRRVLAEKEQLHASWLAEYAAHRATRAELAAARREVAALTAAADTAAQATAWAETVPAPAAVLPPAQLLALRRLPRLAGAFRVPGYAVRYQTPAPA